MFIFAERPAISHGPVGPLAVSRLFGLFLKNQQSTLHILSMTNHSIISRLCATAEVSLCLLSHLGLQPPLEHLEEGSDRPCNKPGVVLILKFPTEKELRLESIVRKSLYGKLWLLRWACARWIKVHVLRLGAWPIANLPVLSESWVDKAYGLSSSPNV